jgi:hypothetical protein
MSWSHLTFLAAMTRVLQCAGARRWLVLSSLAFCVTAPGQARAQETVESADEARYQATVQAALRAFEAGSFDEALRQFRVAHELQPSARTLRGMGMVEFSARHYVRAVEYLEAALTDPRRALTEDLRGSVRVYLRKARAQIGSLQIVISQPEPDLVLLLDGRELPYDANRVLGVDPGVHQLAILRDGQQIDLLAFDIEAGDQRLVQVQVPTRMPAQLASPVSVRSHDDTQESFRPFRRLGLGLAITAAGFASVGAATGATAYVRSDGASGGEAERAVKLAQATDIMLSVAAATGVAAFSVWLVKRKPHESRQRPRAQLSLTPALGEQTCGATLTGRF